MYITSARVSLYIDVYVQCEYYSYIASILDNLEAPFDPYSHLYVKAGLVLEFQTRLQVVTWWMSCHYFKGCMYRNWVVPIATVFTAQVCLCLRFRCTQNKEEEVDYAEKGLHQHWVPWKWVHMKVKCVILLSLEVAYVHEHSPITTSFPNASTASCATPSFCTSIIGM